MNTPKCWVVVADAGRARLFAMDRGPSTLYQMPDAEMEGPHRRGRAIMADRPGRTFDSTGQHRHALEPHTDPERNDELRFLKSVVERIHRAHKGREVEKLVLVAPPRVLGDFRAMLPAGLRKIVTHELARDLAHAPIEDIRDQLAEIMGPRAAKRPGR